MSTAQWSVLLCPQQPASFPGLCALSPCCRGRRQISPPTHSWKSSADFSNAKAATPQTTSSLLLDGESLICPTGDSCSILERKVTSLVCSAYSVQYIQDLSSTPLPLQSLLWGHKPASLSSKFHSLVVGGEHQSTQQCQNFKGNAKCCRKWCS